MKKLYFSAFIILLSSIIFAQDTIVIQTLTFDSITTRRGIWQFPEGEEFRKILMYYTLKCDQQTQHDPFPCGEWDYLTYTNVWNHTGVWDSILAFQPSFTYINGKTTDSLLLRDEPAYSYYRKSHKSPIFEDTLSIIHSEVGQGTLISNNILATSNANGKSQFLWQPSELIDAGLREGNITGIKLHIESGITNIRHLTIKMANTGLDELTQASLVQDLQKVFYNELNVAESGWYDLNFVEPFFWDGVSGIVVELSFEMQGSRQQAVGISDNLIGNWQLAIGGDNIRSDLSLYADEMGWNCGVSSFETNYALSMDGEMDFVDCPDATYFNSNFTVEFWMYKRSNNNWSRVFDFGNGPNQSNVIVTYSQGSSGKLSVHVNNQSGSKSFETDIALPTNEWIHIATRLTNHIGWLYINGEQHTVGILQTPDNVVRTINYIGRSNWSNDTYANGMIDEFRIYNYAKEPQEIKDDYRIGVEDPLSDPGLILYYKFNTGDGITVLDHSASGLDAECYGLPSWHLVTGPEKYMGFTQNNTRPQILFEKIEYSSIQEIVEVVVDSVQNSATQLVLFDNEDDPTIPTDTITSFLGGYMPVYDHDTVYDYVYFDYNSILYKEDLPYYEEPFEIIERHEIGRFITPYGKNLDLGPQGFMWIYDVTDYAHFLQGDVDLSAGNQQELIDMKFIMIKGIPPRDVLKYDRIWGQRRSYSYKSLDSNFVLFDTVYPLLAEASQYKVKTRITGHGHQSSNGEYPHCCEWKDNTHYLLVDGEEIANWHIFQYNDCAWNPVFPQGGTWPGSREGWCPGDLVKEFNFEIEEYVNSDQVSLDYDITPVPPNNQGMGSGNYVMAMHLFQYDGPNFTVDAELYDVVTPNDYEYYSRKNPICSDPTIIIRNNGTEYLTSLKISYGVSGGAAQEYNWTGNLAPNLKETVVLPISGHSFWHGDGSNIFSATVSEPNGLQDQYADNDTYYTHYEMPDLYGETLVLQLKTNLEAWRYTLTIWDIDGNVVHSRSGMTNNTTYNDTLYFDDGCYTMELLDSENMGLSYWAYPDQGTGHLRILNSDGQYLKLFESEFGHKINYTFSYGSMTYVQEPNLDAAIDIYPNPVSDILNIKTHDLEGKANIIIFDSQGKIIYQDEERLSTNLKKEIDLSGYPSGIYVVNVYHNQINIRKKIIKL